MTLPVSASYGAVEAATTRAEMNFMIAFRNEEWLAATPYQSKVNISKVGNSWELDAGATTGQLVFHSTTFGYPMRDVLCKVRWNQSGRATFRAESTIVGQSYNVNYNIKSTVFNNLQDYTRHKDQVWIHFWLNRTDAACPTPKVSDIYINTRPIIPNSEIISYPEVQTSIGKDFLGIIGSKMKVVMDNKDRQWDEASPTGYVYNRPYLEDEFDLFAGLKLTSGRIEYLPVLSGKIDDITLDSEKKLAQISVKGLLVNKLANAIVGGKNITTGEPEPYGAGRRYREQLVETDSTNRVWKYYLKQTPLSFNAVYTRGVYNNLWSQVSSGSYTASPLDKTITFASDAVLTGEVAADVSINALAHPADALRNIVATEAGIDYNSTQLNAIRAGYSDMSAGIRFEEMSGLEAVSRLARVLDIAIHEGVDKLSFVSLQTLHTGTMALAQRDYRAAYLNRSKLKIVNKYSIPYGNYWDDRTKVVSGSDTRSIGSYGIRDLAVIYGGEYSYTYDDPISLNEAGPLLNLVTKLKLRLPFQKDTFRLEDVYSKPLRMELGDKPTFTHPFFGLTNKNLAVYEKNLSLKTKNADISAMGYTPYDQFIFAPTANSNLASSFLNTPVPATTEYRRDYLY